MMIHVAFIVSANGVRNYIVMLTGFLFRSIWFLKDQQNKQTPPYFYTELANILLWNWQILFSLTT